ncbi:Glycogen accumulation regulator GarA [Gimesia alba]|uniref:Glycogen accumulation regulator GarA n=1 Tax=Gimesia alba TaxID=2527973 RepID=A0A517RM74_9PLAN|nr:FHA domain-containing protein [Gimesia alba]QDT44944.1 Glycogen accumulation regulator GarA [Gimesia alba]
MTGQPNYSERKAGNGEMDFIDKGPFALRSITSGATLFFQYSPSLIGRNKKKCHLILNHSSVSRIHCAVFWSRNKLCISDLGSRNGVYVNRQRVSFKKLSVGDKIQIGRFRFQFTEVANNSNEELLLQETKNPNTNHSDSEFSLKDLAISPPSVSPCDLPEYADDIKLFEFDDLSSDLDDDTEGYEINPVVKLPVCPEKLKRRKYSVPDEHEESRRKTTTVLFSIDGLKENPLLRRIFYTAGLIMFFWGLKALWYSGTSDYEIYNALQTKLNIVQSHRKNGAGPLQWETLANNSKTEFQPMISYLEKNASSKNRVKQELLRAARDCLPKVFLESRQEISLHEKRLEKHLETVKMMLENNYIEENNYDSKYPIKPPGS